MPNEKDPRPVAVTEITSDAADKTDARLVGDACADPLFRPAPTHSGPPPRRDMATQEITDGREAVPRTEAIPKRTAVRTPAHEPYRDYAHSPLLTRVVVTMWPQNYNYYRRFLYDAERYFRLSGEECESVPYFSYIPQYAQLSQAQLRFYFYFRSMARHGQYLDSVDFPYILLYIYEIINLPRLLSPARGADALAGIWLAYRVRHPELDKYLAEWMCDYCLVHALPLPSSLTPILPEIIRRASLKEFYMAALPTSWESGELSLPPETWLSSLSDYSYRASRYYEANAALYDRHIPQAAVTAMRRAGLLPEGAASFRASRTERDAFCGSLCAQTVKRRITVEYRSLARSHELRIQMTQAVKLAENGVRRLARIKSRLNVADAPSALAAAITQYFQGNAPAAARRAEDAPEREYEHLYDAPTQGIDFGDAYRIETASWENTARLTDEFSLEEAPAPAVTEIPLPVQETAAERPAVLRYLAPILAGESLTALCRQENPPRSPALVAAEINEYFQEVLGDIVLTEDGASWRLIEDYREELAAMIASTP